MHFRTVATKKFMTVQSLLVNDEVIVGRKGRGMLWASMESTEPPKEHVPSNSSDDADNLFEIDFFREKEYVILLLQRVTEAYNAGNLAAVSGYRNDLTQVRFVD